jgi:hypothetical protein
MEYSDKAIEKENDTGIHWRNKTMIYLNLINCYK